MDKKSLEFSCLLGWLRTFPLQSQVGSFYDILIKFENKT